MGPPESYSQFFLCLIIIGNILISHGSHSVHVFACALQQTQLSGHAVAVFLRVGEPSVRVLTKELR